MRKKAMKRISLFLVAILLSVSICKVEVLASNAEVMQYFNEYLNASRQVIGDFESLGIDIREAEQLKQDVDFCDISVEELGRQVGIDVNVTSRKSNAIQPYSEGIEYDAVFAKQLPVIVNAVNSSLARPSLSERRLNANDEAVYMFISHYLDGNGGLDIYLSQYGYQGQYMADWVTDMDRDAYDRLTSGSTTKETLRYVGDAANIINSGVSHMRSASSTTKLFEHLSSGLADMVLQVGYEQIAPDTFNYSDLITRAKPVLAEAASIRDFQTMFFADLENAYDYLPAASISVLVTIVSAIITAASPISLLIGLSTIGAINMFYLSGDLYSSFNRNSLSLTRNGRVADRVCDYMEYEGYW